MRHLIVLFVHFVATLARLALPLVRRPKGTKRLG
jgi:hypothetical protein